jgi:ABC-2 type transport system permease protein
VLAVSTTWPVGMAVVGAWALVVWLLGAVLLERRDV